MRSGNRNAEWKSPVWPGGGPTSLVNDENKNQRLALLQTEITRVFSGYTAYCEANSEATVGHEQYGDMLSGITHLAPAAAAELYGIIRDYLAAHETRGEHTAPWEYALIVYPVSEEPHA